MVYFHSSISVCNSVDQSAKLMANSVNHPGELVPRSRHNNNNNHHHVNKYRRVANCLNNCSSSSSSSPVCDRSRSAAAIDVVIFIAVVGACGFLLYPYVEFLAVNLIEFVTAVHCVLQDEIGRNPVIYGSIGITTFCAAIGGWIVLLCTARKCMNPNCKGLRKAAEFDIQLETEECVKATAASNNGAGGSSLVSKRGLFELPRDHHRELEAELKKMAPPNGRAVLVFRARCGCSVGRLEVPGAKKLKRIKK
ncbi:Uncharacterized protein At5g19025 [Linum grandiflorum]